METLKRGEIVRCIKDIPGFKKGFDYMHTRYNMVVDENGVEVDFSKYEIDNLFERIMYPNESGNNKLSNKKTDPINPDHYKQYSVEVIDMMERIYGPEQTAIHCELTAFKYRMRAGHKNDIQEDLSKEKWYLDKAKQLRSRK